MIRKIKFKGRNFLLTGDTDGTITTPYLYAHGRRGFAYLFLSGVITKYGQTIGTIKDIEFGEETKSLLRLNLSNILLTVAL